MTITIVDLHCNNVLNIILDYMDYNSYIAFVKAISKNIYRDKIIYNYNRYIISKNNICLLLTELTKTKLTRKNYINYYSKLFNMLTTDSLLNSKNIYGISKPVDVLIASAYYIYLIKNKELSKPIANITSKINQAFYCITSENLSNFNDSEKLLEFRVLCNRILRSYKSLRSYNKDNNNFNKLFKGILDT